MAESRTRTTFSDGGNGIAVVGLVLGVIIGFIQGAWWGLLVYLVAMGIARHADWLAAQSERAGSVSGMVPPGQEQAAALGGIEDDGDVPSGSVRIKPCTLHFSYVDSQGDTSTREVDVSHISAQNFTGWCHLRAEVRTFRWDRVSGDLMDLGTGEIYKTRKAFSELSLQHAM